MTGTLVETICTSLGPIFEDRASALTGLPPDAVRRGLDAAVPALVSGFGDLARTADGSRRFSELVRGPKVDAEFVERAALVVDDDVTRRLIERGDDLAGAVFGARLPAVRNAVAEVARIEGARSALLLSLLTPFALTAIKRTTLRSRLNANGLARLLTGQRARTAVDVRIDRAITTAEPIYLRPSHSKPAPPVREQRRRDTGPPARAPFLAAAVIVAIIAIGGWVIVTDDEEPTDAGTTEVAAEVAPDIPMTRSGIADLNGAFRRIALPDGRAFEAPVGGLADRLASHLRMGGLGEARFPIDTDIRFDPATSRLEPGAGPILDDIAGVLRAYPDARMRMDSPAGDALSARQANAVKRALIERGVDSRRFDPPRVPDADEDGIDIVVGG